MTSLIVATKNLGKLQEMQKAFGEQIHLIGLHELAPDLKSPVENGTSYLENARLKAKYYAEALQQPVLADDGGLELAAFPQLLGVQTHQFFQTETAPEQNQEILNLYQKNPQQNRAFVLHAALAYWGKREFQVEKTLTGEIVAPRGQLGYGFDSILWLPAYQKTLAELPLAQRNALSPRIQALKIILPQILASLSVH